MDKFKTAVEPTHRTVRLLMTDPENNEILKAALPPVPLHPRALLTLLEALSLWVGQPLIVAISVGPSVDRRCGDTLFGGDLMPADSALVRFEFLGPPRRRRTIAGIGDFRQLRLVQRRAP